MDKEMPLLEYPEEVIIAASHLFDSAWYLATYPDVTISGLRPAAHYLKFGVLNNYDPGPDFSTRDYIFLHPDAFPMNPLIHYELIGKAEGRPCRAEAKTHTQSVIVDKSRLKITLISGEPETPGHFYRISHMAQAAKVYGADILELEVDKAFAQCEQITNSTLIIIWRATWCKELASIFSAARKMHVPIIFDIDDLAIDPKLAKIKWIDGIRTIGSTEPEVEQFFETMHITMQNADYCFATTDFLANYMRTFGKKTFVIPNGFDEQTWQASRLAVRTRLNHKHDGLIRIGYAGGSRTHQKDFAQIVNVVARLLHENPQCRLVLFRKQTLPCMDIAEFPQLSRVKHQIEWREMVPLKELPWEMARFDINIAPLEVKNPFCEAKSELKFFESALVEVPIVSSPTRTFCDAIEDGKTGFLAENEENWYQILSNLIHYPDLRKRIGRNAYFSVLWKYGPEHRLELLSSMLEIILHKGTRAARAFEFHLLKSKNNDHTQPIVPPHEIIFSHDKLAKSEMTVIIPSHNYAHYLIEALESVNNQSLTHIDLIVVDDCSEDNSLEIAHGWLKAHQHRFNKILLIKNSKNCGLGLTRNIGFANAETLFVVPLDPDNILLPDFAATCLTAIKETGAAFVYPNIQRFGDDHRIMGIHTFNPLLLACGNYIDAMACIRLSAWAYVGGYHHLQYGWEDYDFWCTFVEHGLYGHYIDEILARYRVHDQSMLNQITNQPENNSKVRTDIHRRHSWVRD